MHNKVVYHTAKALESAGYETLRINFRGVGASTGTHGGGVDEVEDARVALDYLLADQPQAKTVVVAGFSFGALIALRFGCGDARVHRILGIATPARWLGRTALTGCTTPIAFIHGERDDTAPLSDVLQLFGRERVRVIAGADHFFEEHLDALRDAVAASL